MIYLQLAENPTSWIVSCLALSLPPQCSAAVRRSAAVRAAAVLLLQISYSISSPL